MQQCCESSSSNGWGTSGNRCDDCANFKSPISVIGQDHDVGFRTCVSFGRYFFRTFDGREYNFAGTCKYVLSADYAGQWQVYLEPIGCDSLDTCTKKITVLVHLHKTLELFEGRCFVDGQEIDLVDKVPISSAGYMLMRNGDWILVSTYETKLRLKVNAKATVYLTMDNDYATSMLMVVGLCGNNDGFYQNDFMTRLGTTTVDAASFAKSWITDDYSD
ncbi:mucin-2-like, partial [Mizuhopecten yessoensis]|uniref:mucin-2-like n=1 Tax=Mizuhopecten yessoensis TaxID=6573 RepID=UPI000B45AE0F